MNNICKSVQGHLSKNNTIISSTFHLLKLRVYFRNFSTTKDENRKKISSQLSCEILAVNVGVLLLALTVLSTGLVV